MTVNVVIEVVVGGSVDEEKRAVGPWLCYPRPKAFRDRDEPDEHTRDIPNPPLHN